MGGRIVFLQKQFSTYKEPEDELEAIKQKHEMNRLINDEGKVSSDQQKVFLVAQQLYISIFYFFFSCL